MVVDHTLANKQNSAKRGKSETRIPNFFLLVSFLAQSCDKGANGISPFFIN